MLARYTPRLGALFGALLLALAAEARPAGTNDPWARVPEILARIVPPKFPAREFDVTKFGAVADGKTICTKAFADAIATCQRGGGGKVLVPAGEFLTGAIHLKSGVNLHLVKGATIKFSTDPKDFLPVVFSRSSAEMMNYSPFIYALDQTNIAVTGDGALDGQASKSVWPDWVKKNDGSAAKLSAMAEKGVPVKERVMEGEFMRPHFVQPVRCRGVLIEGVTILDSPNWVISPLYCTNVTVRGVTVNSHGKNNDGCDPDSTRDMLIENCVFDTGDDCIAVKSGRDIDGRRINIPSENIIVRHCRFKDGHGGVTIGSETAGGIRNVFAEDCEFDSPNLEQALRFKTNPARGGFIENIFMRRCTVKTAKFGIHMTMRYASSGLSSGDTMPVVKNIDIRDCSFAKLSKQPIFIEGWSPDAQITDVTIANCQFPGDAKPNTITNATRINISK